jgi:hypothetical protein
MGIEPWVPDEDKGEKLVHVRLSADLVDFLDYTRMIFGGCSQSDALRIQLEYASKCREASRMIIASQVLDGRVPIEAYKLALAALTESNEVVRRFVKRKERAKRDTENRISPAMIDAGRDAGKIVTAFQPTTNGQPDKIANRTTAEGGFRVGGDNKKLPTSDEAAERGAFSTVAGAGGAPTTTLASSDGKINTAPTREKHDKGVKRRAKKRGDNTVMSGEGWA